ncbi:hypothetical protein EVAR_86014_1 [Eumeta japonica]|uniref:Uncharacterized protein n=1 Tax=Eumeta variegata TaxID=151549 RepID=A0A4C1UKL9_EUMVA|nr:hypothetical protein EVAR_86014_1 [Eumeta japonica]
MLLKLHHTHGIDLLQVDPGFGIVYGPCLPFDHDLLRKFLLQNKTKAVNYKGDIAYGLLSQFVIGINNVQERELSPTSARDRNHLQDRAEIKSGFPLNLKHMKGTVTGIGALIGTEFETVTGTNAGTDIGTRIEHGNSGVTSGTEQAKGKASTRARA